MRAGGTLATGGHPLPGRGFFYAPTVITDVEPGMAAFDEETFGPVAAVIRARDDAHAVELANRSRYGLGASVWSRDRARAPKRWRGALEAGSVFVNGIVKSDPRLPFGGIKRSGYGRELAAAGHPRVREREDGVGRRVGIVTSIGAVRRRMTRERSVSSRGTGASSEACRRTRRPRSGGPPDDPTMDSRARAHLGRLGHHLQRRLRKTGPAATRPGERHRADRERPDRVPGHVRVRRVAQHGLRP